MNINIIRCDECKYLREYENCNITLDNKLLGFSFDLRCCDKFNWMLPKDIDFCTLGKPKD